MKITILIFLFFFSMVSVLATAPNKLVKILDRSVKAIGRVETLEGDFFIRMGNMMPGDHSFIADLQDRFILKKHADDTVVGMWFREDVRELSDTANWMKFYYDGKNVVSYHKGAVEKNEAATATNKFVVGINEKLFDAVRSCWQKVT